MQQLDRRNTFTPKNTPHVPGNCNRSLNKEETLSVTGLKTLSNNSDVDQPSPKRGQNLRVPVLNLRGEPLMPTYPRKAKKLLREGKAKVVSRKPFVIQLLYATGETKQDIILGIDVAYLYIGFSSISGHKELICGEVHLRDDISKLIKERSRYRRNRRNRLWYRQPRFNNRKKEENWISPSLKHKLDSHVRLIGKIKKILPVTKTIVEIASFDTQKMQNPEISGIEYQQGELQGYEIKEYLLEKWGRKCAYCGRAGMPLQTEHIISRSRNGSNKISNLTIACQKCNQKKGTRSAEEFGFPDIQEKAKKSLRAPAFMNIIRKKLVDILKCEYTYGYITKYNRIILGLEKSHVNDAFVIAGGTDNKRCKSYIIKQNRRNNRSLQLNRKGFKPSIRKKRYKLQKNDLVRYDGDLYRKKDEQLYKVKGVFNYGKWVRLKNVKGFMINTNINDVKIVKYGKGFQWI